MHAAVLPEHPSSPMAAGTWPDIDPALVEDRRHDAPAFPLDLLPAPWRTWIADTARAAGAPVDYAALSVLGAVAGLSGDGIVAQVVPAWRENLVLRLALIGQPSSGKTPAVQSVRHLLRRLEVELQLKGPMEPWLMVPEPDVAVIDEVLEVRRHAVLLWRDWGSPCLARLPHPAAPASVLGMLSPDRLQRALAEADDGMASRFLYAWPDPPPYCRLLERRAAEDQAALVGLRRVLGLAGVPEEPRVLAFDAPALAALDDFLADRHDRCRDAEGLQGAWLGKGAGTMVKLAAIIELLAWTGGEAPAAPAAIRLPAVQAAIALWRDYFCPHATLVFDAGGPDDLLGQARRVVRWLRSNGADEVTREQVRRQGLSFSVNAARAEMVLARLYAGGIVRPARQASGPQGGRPANSWEISPRLRENEPRKPR